MITDGDGTQWTVVGGASLPTPYALAPAMEAIEPQVRGRVAGGENADDVQEELLTAAGFPPIYVQRIPDARNPGPPEGHQRVYVWDGSTLLMGLERPSRAFYEGVKRRADSPAAEAEAQLRLDAWDALPEDRPRARDVDREVERRRP